MGKQNQSLIPVYASCTFHGTWQVLKNFLQEGWKIGRKKGMKESGGGRQEKGRGTAGGGGAALYI